eukprot:CAMPEP_0168521692 /NCGR_PEP_ID=MMETSP0405-20121227/8823_1 /TAXON_ID=498012 /ORGANISM="Trichosphaerium sp, Strain Am-I-7 wt" /LENGTH=104 /DNA_ID=CAMNT_0008542991 /DNA_START=880 /DNA_END=1194 /DNA_ORIENTATION=+
MTGDFNFGPGTKPFKYTTTNDKVYKFNHAYSNYNNTGREPPFSTYKPSYTEFIDYIWYWSSNDSIGPLRVLSMPTEAQVSAEKGLPSTNYPSDHLPLLAEFGTR